MAQGWPTQSILLFFVFGFLVLMSIWSLLATMCTDPGFIPFNYEYDVTKMTRTMESLYKFVGLH